MTFSKVINSWYLVGLSLLLVACQATHQNTGQEVANVKKAESQTSVQKRYPSDLSREDRIQGAIMGFLAGDAMGLGTHWYYDLDELRKDYGPWIDRYQNPAKNGSHSFAHISRYRYEQGLRAGDISQDGQLFTLLLESVVENKGFKSEDFHQRLDQFFKTINGESLSGRYTNGVIRHLRAKRLEGISWNDPTIAVDNTESLGAALSVVLAVTYDDPVKLTQKADLLMQPLVEDGFLRSNQIVYALVLQALIQGVQLEALPEHLMTLYKNPEIKPYLSGFDTVMTPTNGSAAWESEHIRIEPALYASKVFGMDCQVMHLLPAVYYLIYRYPNNFEMSLLSAINGGGQNMARAALVGALSGAMNGLKGIPERFVRDLKGSSQFLKLSQQLAENAVKP